MALFKQQGSGFGREATEKKSPRSGRSIALSVSYWPMHHPAAFHQDSVLYGNHDRSTNSVQQEKLTCKTGRRVTETSGGGIRQSCLSISRLGYSMTKGSTNVAVVLLFGFACVEALATETLPKNVSRFIPPGYEVAQHVVADFNGDGRPDIALLTWRAQESFEERPLIVLIKQRNGNYKQSIRVDHLLRQDPAGCGCSNAYCVPDLQVSGSTLRIVQTSGCQSGSSTFIAEYKLLQGQWYEVGDVSYERSLKNLCDSPEFPKLKVDERCLEHGTRNNYIRAQQTEYWEIVRGDEAVDERGESIERAVPKSKLKRLHDLDTEAARQFIGPDAQPRR